MDGIAVPILGALVGAWLFIECLVTHRFRRFAFAALVSPFAASLAFILGSFILADMNPAREYGASYVLTGNEHDSTKTDVLLWLLSVPLTFLVSGFICFKLQQLGGGLLQRIRPRRSE